MTKFLSGKVAVVTGGGRGIGRATALKLAAAGATPVVAARGEAELLCVVDEIESLGGRALAQVVDVTRSAEVNAFAEELAQRFGQVDILVNSAGVALIAPLPATTEEEWDQVIDTNLKGTFLVTRALLGLLQSAGSGLVVNIASKVALSGHASVSAYTAAKAGVVGFTRSLAKELIPDHIRLVAICPGAVDTPMRWDATPDMDPGIVLSAGAVAETVMFLARIGKDVTMGEIVIQNSNYDEDLVSVD